MDMRMLCGCVNVVDVSRCAVLLWYLCYVFVERRTFAVTCFLAVMLNTFNLHIANIVKNK